MLQHNIKPGGSPSESVSLSPLLRLSVPGQLKLAVILECLYAPELRAEGAQMPAKRNTLHSRMLRYCAIYLAHTLLGLSITAVAGLFNRDRSTIRYACSKVEMQRDDPAFDAWLETVENHILEDTNP